jgi:hypothetical protein
MGELLEDKVGIERKKALGQGSRILWNAIVPWQL